MADTVHAYNCSGEHDIISGACVGFKEGDRVRYLIGGEALTKPHTVAWIMADAKAVLDCDEGDGCYPPYGVDSPVWLSRLRLADAPVVESEARHILAHLAITLSPNDTRTEAEIESLLKGVIEVGNGYSEFDVEITLVEEV